MQITVIERAQQIQIQEQEIIRRERELEATVRKPAEAEKYRLEKIADANRWVITCTLSCCLFTVQLIYVLPSDPFLARDSTEAHMKPSEISNRKIKSAYSKHNSRLVKFIVNIN